ncbi:tyrosine-type recombinase/integrase [Actinoplanes sp. URMC 104]|uniref:tyrosine-type recombinase/integrase n=1 Tax=Actinoplanes sp. URMC 104 TaxID=3423409 RepID=UPI003F1B8D98
MTTTTAPRARDLALYQEHEAGFSVRDLADDYGLELREVRQVLADVEAWLATVPAEQRPDLSGPSFLVEVAEAEVVEGELVDDPPPTPSTALVHEDEQRKRWTPTGKAAAALAGQLERYDPQGRLTAIAKMFYDKGESQSTVDTMRFQWMRFCLWCYEHKLDPLPADAVTVHNWIGAHWEMRDVEGKKRGRKGQPYSPNTVRLSLAAIARAHRRYFTQNPAELARFFSENPGELEAAAARKGRDRGALPTPTAHQYVTQAMKGYAKEWYKHGFVEDVAASITVDEMYAMVRTCDLNTVWGIRDAFLMRLAADTGRRNSELMSLDWVHLKMLVTGDAEDELLEVRIPLSKTNQDGSRSDKAYVSADTTLHPELDTLKLMRMWKAVCAAQGFTSGPVFRKVRGTGQERKDGQPRGVIRDERMTRKNYQDIVAQAAHLSGVDIDPGDPEGGYRRCVPHMFRVFMARRLLAAGGTIGQVCDQGGWSRNSPVVLRYDREADAERAENTAGAMIRAAELRRREAKKESADKDATIAKLSGEVARLTAELRRVTGGG